MTKHTNKMVSNQVTTAFETHAELIVQLAKAIEDLHKRVQDLEMNYMEEKLLGKPKDSGKIGE